MKVFILSLLLLLVTGCINSKSSNKSSAPSENKTSAICAEETGGCGDNDVIYNELPSGDSTSEAATGGLPPDPDTIGPSDSSGDESSSTGGTSPEYEPVTMTSSTSSTSGGNTPPPTSEESFKPIKADWPIIYEESKTEAKEIECEAPKEKYDHEKKGTITIAGGENYYIPSTGLADFKHNTSPFLSRPNEAKKLFELENLQLRFKIRPAPFKDAPWCFGQKKGNSPEWGYTILQYKVSIISLDDKGKFSTNKKNFEHTKTYETNTYTCSKMVNFSGHQNKYKNGFIIAIHDVKADQACWYEKKDKCKDFVFLPESSCWQMDIEAYGNEN